MARVIDKDYLLTHKRKVRFFGIGPDDESWGYAVPVEVIENAPTLTPQNEPLTIEELREMDGDPVWVKCLKPDKYVDPPEKWRILEKSITGNFGVWNGESALIERVYGVDWLAYRRPPKGEK